MDEICDYVISDRSKGSARDAQPPHCPNSFIFMKFLAKICEIIGWRTPFVSWRSLENPGSATGLLCILPDAKKTTLYETFALRKLSSKGLFLRQKTFNSFHYFSLPRDKPISHETIEKKNLDIDYPGNLKKTLLSPGE